MSERTKAENIRKACAVIRKQDETMTYEEKRLRDFALGLLDADTAADLITLLLKE